MPTLSSISKVDFTDGDQHWHVLQVGGYLTHREYINRPVSSAYCPWCTILCLQLTSHYCKVSNCCPKYMFLQSSAIKHPPILQLVATLFNNLQICFQYVSVQ